MPFRRPMRYSPGPEQTEPRFGGPVHGISRRALECNLSLSQPSYQARPSEMHSQSLSAFYKLSNGPLLVLRQACSCMAALWTSRTSPAHGPPTKRSKAGGISCFTNSMLSSRPKATWERISSAAFHSSARNALRFGRQQEEAPLACIEGNLHARHIGAVVQERSFLA